MKTIRLCWSAPAALILAGSFAFSQMHYTDRSVQVDGVMRMLDDSIVIKHSPTLEYPAVAAKAGMSGVVLFMVQVDSTGRARSPEVTMTDEEIFVATTLAAASNLVFTVPSVDHKPVSMTQGLIAVYTTTKDSSGQPASRASLSMVTSNLWKEFQIAEPVIEQKQDPEYPVAAKEQKVQGNVWVKMWVSPKGIPLTVSVIKSRSPLLEESALQAAKQFRFKPGTIREKPAWCSVVIPFAFKLK